MMCLRLVALVLPLALLPSCMVGPNYQTPGSRVQSNWETNSTISGQPLNAGEAYWWRSLNDPVLDRLVEAAVKSNLTVQIAGVRVLKARAQLSKSIGDLFPQQQGISGGVNYDRLNSGFGKIPGITPDYASDQLLFAATWEIDVWGKYRRDIESKRATFVGSVADYDDAVVSLIADVANFYVLIRTTEARIRVTSTNVYTQKETLRVANVKFDFGETSELDMRQAAAVTYQTEAQLPKLQRQLQETKNALGVLLGTTPDQVDGYLTGPSAIPTPPIQVAVGIPKDLLRRRPDVRAAAMEAASKSALIGVAKANMYPAFSLSGAFGVSANNELGSSLSDMFMWQSRAAQAGASFFFPVFNYGRLINQVRVQDAEFVQGVLHYQETVLKAQSEVENGLAAFYYEQQALTNLTIAAINARRATELSAIQYREGEADYTTVLSTEQTQLSLDDTLAQTQGKVALGLIAIYRALGGGWEIREGGDVVSDEVKEELRKRTYWGNMLEAKEHLPPKGPEQAP